MNLRETKGHEGKTRVHSLHPIPFEEAVSAILEAKPPPEKKKRRGNRRKEEPSRMPE